MMGSGSAVKLRATGGDMAAAKLLRDELSALVIVGHLGDLKGNEKKPVLHAAVEAAVRERGCDVFVNTFVTEELALPAPIEPPMAAIELPPMGDAELADMGL